MTVNAIVDICYLVTFIASLLTGRVLYFFLPSGGGRGGSCVNWMGIPRSNRALWHEVASFAFAALIIVHLLLHWTFFRHIGKYLKPGGVNQGEDTS